MTFLIENDFHYHYNSFGGRMRVHDSIQSFIARGEYSGPPTLRTSQFNLVDKGTPRCSNVLMPKTETNEAATEV